MRQRGAGAHPMENTSKASALLVRVRIHGNDTMRLSMVELRLRAWWQASAVGSIPTSA